MPLSVIVPSHLRPRLVLVNQVIEHDGICVADSQVEAYRSGNPGQKIIAHPDSVIGLPAKREWICRHFGDVFMIDDDVNACLPLWHPHYRGVRKLDKSSVRQCVEAAYQMARRLDVFLFGLAGFSDSRYFYSQRPFRMTGYINGCAFGLRAGSGLDFGSRYGIVAVEDIFISALNANRHRRLFIDERFGFRQATTFRATGGLGAHRTSETEVADTAILKKLFGDAIQCRKNLGADFKPQRFYTVSPRRVVVPF